jgi:outer membrane protein
MKKLLVFVTLSMLFFGAQAQKFGYLNSAAILEEMQEVKAANTNIQTFQEQLMKKGRASVESLQKKYQDLTDKEKRGELSPKQLQDEGAKLKQEEEGLAKMEQDMQEQVGKKRQELLDPILLKVNNAIKDIAKEQGYAYIFDSNAGVLLYADEKTDVANAVRTKLGIPIPAATKN